MGDELLTIRAVADRFGLTLRSLRFWEDKGLISPAREGQARLYAPSLVAHIEQIAAWSRAGITLREIRMLLRMKDDAQPTASYISGRASALRQEALDQIAAIDALSSSPLPENGRTEFEPPTQDWIPVHRRTLALLGNHKALRAGLGKLSPAKCAELGMDEASAAAIEALYGLLESDDYFMVCEAPATGEQVEPPHG